MKDSVAKARQLRIAEQTQAEIAEIKTQLDRIEARLDQLLATYAPVSATEGRKNGKPEKVEARQVGKAGA